MIEARISKRLGSFQLEAEMKDEGFITVIGRNGAGKSTLLRCIAGQSRIDTGFVRLHGEDVTGAPRERRGMITVTPSSSIPHLDVESHLRWGAKLRRVALDEGRVSSVRRELGIDFSGRVRTLSLGMRERLALATSLLAAPRLILVDEAFANLHDREAFVASYRRLAREAGIDVISSTQLETDASLSDHSYRIVDGKTERLS